MQYRVGQKVRLLHQDGEGVIISLIDNRHVEVDLGDDFPLDVHVDEIISIDAGEGYLTDDKRGRPEQDQGQSMNERPMQLGLSILDLSLVVLPLPEDEFAFSLVNPEPAAVLYTCYRKAKGKTIGMVAGQVGSGHKAELFRLEAQELLATKLLYFQLITFVPGRGYPHQPEIFQLAWNKGRLQQPTKLIPVFNQQAWAFSLRHDRQAADVDAINDQELLRVMQEDTPVVREQLEVDLHIEELVPNPKVLRPEEMLGVQLAHVEKALSNALVHHYDRVIFIHGIGAGKLKAAVHTLLRQTPHVRRFQAAEVTKYGNGATEVWFK
jgi:hypothetical protein